MQQWFAQGHRVAEGGFQPVHATAGPTINILNGTDCADTITLWNNVHPKQDCTTGVNLFLPRKSKRYMFPHFSGSSTSVVKKHFWHSHFIQKTHVTLKGHLPTTLPSHGPRSMGELAVILKITAASIATEIVARLLPRADITFSYVNLYLRNAKRRGKYVN